MFAIFFVQFGLPTLTFGYSHRIQLSAALVCTNLLIFYSWCHFDDINEEIGILYFYLPSAIFLDYSFHSGNIEEYIIICRTFQFSIFHFLVDKPRMWSFFVIRFASTQFRNKVVCVCVDRTKFSELKKNSSSFLMLFKILRKYITKT